MTAVLYYKDRVYADSTVIKGSERLDSLIKIKSFDAPFKIVSDREGFVIDDVVHGYSGTGSHPAMDGLVTCLETDMNGQGNIHGAIGHFNMAYAGGLLVFGNVFEAILVGEKGNHSFRFDSEGFNYTFYDKDKMVGLGTGGQEVITHLKHHGDPIRAMYQAFASDELSGGWIDCWEMVEVEKEIEGEKITRWTFRRRGMREPIPRDLILHVLDMHWPKPGVDKVPLQFRRQAPLKTEMTRLYLENKVQGERIVELEEDREATRIIHANAISKLRKQIAKLKREAKPITVKNLVLPPKVTAPAGAAAIPPRSRRKPQSLPGDGTNYR